MSRLCLNKPTTLTISPQSKSCILNGIPRCVGQNESAAVPAASAWDFVDSRMILAYLVPIRKARRQVFNGRFMNLHNLDTTLCTHKGIMDPSFANTHKDHDTTLSSSSRVLANEPWFLSRNVQLHFCMADVLLLELSSCTI